jgi:hypothetical protein
MHMFLARGGRKVSEQKLDHNEEIIVELYSIDELKSLVKKNEIVQGNACYLHIVCAGED